MTVLTSLKGFIWSLTWKCFALKNLWKCKTNVLAFKVKVNSYYCIVKIFVWDNQVFSVQQNKNVNVIACIFHTMCAKVLEHSASHGYLLPNNRCDIANKTDYTPWMSNMRDRHISGVREKMWLDKQVCAPEEGCPSGGEPGVSGGEPGVLHKVCLVLQLHHGLEDQRTSAHAQQTARVLCVGKHSPCAHTHTHTHIFDKHSVQISDRYIVNLTHLTKWFQLSCTCEWRKS